MYNTEEISVNSVSLWLKSIFVFLYLRYSRRSLCKPWPIEMA